MQEKNEPILASESDILTRYRNDRQFLYDVYSVFLEEIPRVRSKLTNARESDDFARIEETAHPLRSSCGAIGAYSCATIATKLEDAALRKAAEDVDFYLAALHDQLGRLESSIKERIDESTP